MAIYIKKFPEHTPYSEYIEGEDAVFPNVSACITNKHVHYNPRRAAKYTLTFINRGNTLSDDTQSADARGIAKFTAPATPASWTEHTFLGWSEVEYPTYAQTQQSGFLKQPDVSPTSWIMRTSLWEDADCHSMMR